MLKKLLSTYGFAGLTVLLASCDNHPNNSTNDSPIGASPIIEPTTNEPPTISAVNVVDINGGEIEVGDVLEGQYTYYDADGDLEGDSTYQWLRGLDTEEQQDGAALRGNFTPIFEATSKTYTVTAEDIDYQLMVEVVPAAQTGELLGEVVTFEPTPTRAGFILLGGLIHLLLDELYSVDLNNVTIKRSFGTALKIADFDNKLITLASIIAIAGLIYVAPPTKHTIIALSDWSNFRFLS